MDMFHLNRFEQHQWFIGQGCDPSCVVCQKQHANPMELKSILSRAKQKDILNIYGVTDARDVSTALKAAKEKKLISRVWVTHKLIRGIDAISGEIDNLVIWCPGAQKDSFNNACGEDYFDDFKLNIQRLSGKKTLSLFVKQINIDELPEFYDLVHDCNAEGMLLYYPKEFNKEERRYIKRFKKVPGMRIIPLINAPVHTCLGMPNTMGLFHFEWHEWCHAIRGSLKTWPLIKYAV